MLSFIAEALMKAALLAITLWGAAQAFSCMELLARAVNEEYVLRVNGAILASEKNLEEATHFLKQQKPEAQREIEQAALTLRRNVEEWASHTHVQVSEHCGEWLKLRVCVRLHREKGARPDIPNWRFVWQQI